MGLLQQAPTKSLPRLAVPSVLLLGRRITFKAPRAAGLYQGQTEQENQLIQHPCLYMVTRSLDPTGGGRARWMVRWKPALNAFAITFQGRLDSVIH